MGVGDTATDSGTSGHVYNCRPDDVIRNYTTAMEWSPKIGRSIPICSGDLESYYKFERAHTG